MLTFLVCCNCILVEKVLEEGGSRLLCKFNEIVSYLPINNSANTWFIEFVVTLDRKYTNEATFSVSKSSLTSNEKFTKYKTEKFLFIQKRI